MAGLADGGPAGASGGYILGGSISGTGPNKHHVMTEGGLYFPGFGAEFGYTLLIYPRP